MKNLACNSTKQKLSTMIFGLTLLLMSVANVSFAKDVTLAWDANQESDVAGYKVYYGTNPGAYTGAEAMEGPSPVEMGDGTSATFVGLDDTKTHYFTVTAFNFNGEESAYANEVNAPARSNNDFDGDGYDLTVDCDDYNAAINPGATEIPGNDIDENCNGMDDDVQIVTPGGAIEAESGNLTAPMVKVADLAASNGFYIQTSTDNNGTANYNFNITAPGVYKIVARVFAANQSTDSFFVTIDNASEVIWDLNPTGTAKEFNAWREDNVTSRGAGSFDNPQYDPYTVELQNGTHSISFRGREANAKFDYFRLVKVGEVTITDADHDGYDVNSDCNDNNAAINPGATEIPYNGIDENCNGMADDNDLDNDGYSSLNDCNDNDPAINPGAVEIHNNGVDENCNGMDDDVQITTPTGVIEAESGNLTAPMVKVADLAATNGSYIQTSTDNNGTANYNFNITAPGVYKIVARVFTANQSTDSFFVTIDNASEVIWDLNPTGSANEFNIWREDNITSRGAGSFDNPQYDPYTVELQNGTHSISFRGRETNAKLDYFYLVKVGESTIADADLDGYDVNSDCDDNNAAINPGATEVPGNGIDENCNGMADDTAADTVAPTITIISPADGTTLKGRWSTIRVEATDDVIVMKTEIYIDGKLELEEPGDVAQLRLNLKTISKGSHTISAKVYDQAWNVAESAITVVK